MQCPLVCVCVCVGGGKGVLSLFLCPVVQISNSDDKIRFWGKTASQKNNKFRPKILQKKKTNPFEELPLPPPKKKILPQSESAPIENKTRWRGRPTWRPYQTINCFLENLLIIGEDWMVWHPSRVSCHYFF